MKSRTWLWVMLLRACLVLCIVIAPFQVLGPLGLLAQGHTAAAWGLIQAVFSAGMMAGAAIAFRYKPKRPMVMVCLMGTTAVAAPLALALGGSALTLGIVYAVRGVGVGLLVAVWNTTLQTQIEGEALGRVTAWDWMSSLALWPAGLAVAGPLAQAFGVTTLCWVIGRPRPGGLGLGAAREGRLAAAAGGGAGGGSRRPFAAAGRPAARLTAVARRPAFAARAARLRGGRYCVRERPPP